MTTDHQPNLTKSQLLKSLVIALIIGIVVLLTAVLPAEYGIDPLGTGQLFGFSKLYQETGPVATNDTSSNLNFKKIKCLIEIWSRLNRKRRRDPFTGVVPHWISKASRTCLGRWIKI